MREPCVDWKRLLGGGQAEKELRTGSLSFENNYAMQADMKDMPSRDFTVEFWAQTPAINTSASADALQNFMNFLSYATHLPESERPYCMGLPPAHCSTPCKRACVLVWLASRDMACGVQSPWGAGLL